MARKVPSSTVESADPAGASIRVVANRTGIAADTLRVWERRYGFPAPARRPGGTRVYSEDDVARLDLLARALVAGFRPGEVVPLAPEHLAKLMAVSVGPARASSPKPPGLAPSVETIVAAVQADDVAGLELLLRSAAIGLGPRAFVTEIAHPLVVRVGDLWAAGALAIRHEHLVSASLARQLHVLLGALADGERSPSILLATLPDEPHTLGLDLVAVHLATSFAAPHMLGGDTPPAQIAEAASAQRVDVVGLSISPAAEVSATAGHLRALAKALPPSIALWLGGAGARRQVDAAPHAHVVATWLELDTVLASWRRAAGR